MSPVDAQLASPPARLTLCPCSLSVAFVPTNAGPAEGSPSRSRNPGPDAFAPVTGEGDEDSDVDSLVALAIRRPDLPVVAEAADRMATRLLADG